MQIVTTHKNTDFDALASTIAATILYPGCIPVLPRTINPNVKAFLSIHKDLFDIRTADEIDDALVTTLIVVDVNNWKRLGQIKRLKKKQSLQILLWDHHAHNGNIDAQWQCQEPVGATITLMIRELQARATTLTPVQATLFMAGLYEDTGNLSFPSTRPEDARAAAWLLEQKADLTLLNSFLRPAYGEKQKNVLFEMLHRARRTRINGLRISINQQPINGHVDSLAVVLRMYREILNVDGAFGIFHNEAQQTCMVIGRSNSDRLNVGAIMKGLGGGGHPGAGSAMLKKVNPAVVEQMLHELITGNRLASVQISDLMSFPVVTVKSDTTMEAVAEILRKTGCTGLPVVNDDHLVGMISRRDFRKIKNDRKLAHPVSAFMNRNVVTIDPGKSPMEAARLMVKYDIGRLPVVDNGRIIGIITRSDSMLYFYDMLPD